MRFKGARMHIKIGDLVAFKHTLGGTVRDCVGKVIEFTFNSPDPEFVIRPIDQDHIVRKDGRELSRPARRRDRKPARV